MAAAHIDDVSVAQDIDAAIGLAEQQISAGECEGPVWIAGGGTIYEQTLAQTDLIVRTLVDCEVEGDAHFPDLSRKDWKIIRREHFSSDERHASAFEIQWLSRGS